MPYIPQLIRALSRTVRRTRWGGVPDPVARDVLAMIGHLEENHRKALEAWLAWFRPVGFEPIGAGLTSVVLDIGRGRVLRIGAGPLACVPVSVHVNQPLERWRAGWLRVEVYPKLDTAGITDADVERVRQALEAEGLEFHDPGPDNLGRDQQGNLKVLDPGAVRFKVRLGTVR